MDLYTSGSFYETISNYAGVMQLRLVTCPSHVSPAIQTLAGQVAWHMTL